jgi:DNA (cytosine-5)-methyltransferase 1
MKRFTYIDLFCGPGGLSTGFKNSSFTPLIAVEISDWTVKTYAKNHNAEIIPLDMLLKNKGNLESILTSDNRTCLIHGDVRNVSNDIILEILQKKFKTSTVDVVVGCPPCESFSMAGLRSENDERNDLFANILRIAHCVDSKFVFFENVSGLLTKSRNGQKGGQFDYIINQFEQLNPDTGNKYILASKDTNVIKLTATDYGVPQKRERVFLVGCNSKYGSNKFTYPLKTHGPSTKYSYLSVFEAFYNLPLFYSNEGSDSMQYSTTYEDDYLKGKISDAHYNYMKFICGGEGFVPAYFDETKGIVTAHKAANHRPYMVERFKNIKQGESMLSAVKRLKSEGKEDIVKEYFPKKLFAARGRTLKADEPSFTVTSHCFDEMLHPFCYRSLTPREAARLQTFPDWYEFEGPYLAFHSSPEQDKYEQIGDAVPVLLARALGGSLYNALTSLS